MGGEGFGCGNVPFTQPLPLQRRCIEKSLIRAVEEGKAEYALDWYKHRER